MARQGSEWHQAGSTPKDQQPPAAAQPALGANIVIWLLMAVVMVGAPILGLLAELAALDTRRTQAAADAALRRAMEPLPVSTLEPSRHADQAGIGAR